MMCSRCHEDKPRDQFNRVADMYPKQRQCKECARRRASIRRHGIDAAQKTLIAEHRGGCAICGHSEPSAKGWVVDHDRSCCEGDESCPKCRRGVVCQWCNMLLANAFDRVEILRAAIRYLEAPRGCDWHMPVQCAPRICGRIASASATNEEERTSTYADVVT